MAYQGLTLDNPFTGQSIHFLVTSRQTQGQELVLQSSWRGRSPEPPAHYHPGQEEVFEVLQGQLTVRLAGELHQVQAGQRLRIGPGQPHSMWNAAEERTIARWVTRPARRSEELLETTFALAQAGLVRPDGTPGLLQAAVLLGEFSQEFRLVRPGRWAQRLVFGLLRPVARLLGVRAHYGSHPQPRSKKAVVTRHLSGEAG